MTVLALFCALFELVGEGTLWVVATIDDRGYSIGSNLARYAAPHRGRNSTQGTTRTNFASSRSCPRISRSNDRSVFRNSFFCDFITSAERRRAVKDVPITPQRGPSTATAAVGCVDGHFKVVIEPAAHNVCSSGERMLAKGETLSPVAKTSGAFHEQSTAQWQPQPMDARWRVSVCRCKIGGQVTFSRRLWLAKEEGRHRH